MSVQVFIVQRQSLLTFQTSQKFFYLVGMLSFDTRQLGLNYICR